MAGKIHEKYKEPSNNIAKQKKSMGFQDSGIPATTSGHLGSRATAVNISQVTVSCFPFDIKVFAMLPAHGFWRETVSLLDVM